MAMTVLEEKILLCDHSEWIEIIKVIKGASLQELKDCWNSIHNVTNKSWLHFAGAVRYEIEIRELLESESKKDDSFIEGFGTFFLDNFKKP